MLVHTGEEKVKFLTAHLAAHGGGSCIHLNATPLRPGELNVFEISLSFIAASSSSSHRRQATFSSTRTRCLTSREQQRGHNPIGQLRSIPHPLDLETASEPVSPRRCCQTAKGIATENVIGDSDDASPRGSMTLHRQRAERG
jgi:hypothetical protein